MSVSPWLKFYPSDWRSDPTLRMCSLAARGLWMEMLCIMHEATPRGFLFINGNPVSDQKLASLAGTSPRETAKLLSELETAGVFSRDETGLIFSRRMVRDAEKAERDKENGRRGGNPKITPGVNPSDNSEDKAHKPEARGQNNLLEKNENRSFPPDGSIAYTPWADVARQSSRGVDVDLLASAYRSWCRSKDIALDGPGHSTRFATFCKNHKVRGLHAA